MENSNKLLANVLEGKVSRGGIFTFELRRDGELIDIWDFHNLVPTAGLNYLNDAGIGGGSQISSWYIGLYSNAYTPQADDVYTHIGTRFTEITTAYDETTRPAWTKDGASSSGLMTNSSSRATFTFNTSATVNGAIFVSNNVKGDNTSGTLLAASLHTPARSVVNGDELLVKYEFQASSS
jgi:hypothetical protein